MFNDQSLKQIFGIVLVAIILYLAFLIIKPIALAIIFGLILAYIFYPVNQFLLKYLKNETITTSLVCIVALAIIFISFWFLLPVLANQIFDSYSSLQKLEIIGFLQKQFPFLFTSDKISASVFSTYNKFVANSADVLLEKVTEYLADLPSLLLKFFVVLVVFFYSLRDGDKLLKILRDTLPFNRDITNKFIKKSRETTYSVVYGRVVVGVITGLLTGASFFLAGVPNSLLLTVFAIIAAIIPIIGPWIIWIPVVVSLFVTGQTVAGIILLLYCGIFISTIDNVLHAFLIAKQTHVPTSITLIGLIGGLFVFGIFGIILGPLIAAYLQALFEIYRDYNVKDKKNE